MDIVLDLRISKKEIDCLLRSVTGKIEIDSILVVPAHSVLKQECCNRTLVFLGCSTPNADSAFHSFLCIYGIREIIAKKLTCEFFQIDILDSLFINIAD